MQSQIQCPVCTLYLHVGMNLQVHLDTHPKEQVITALVNLTLLQQQTNDTDEHASSFQCSRYAPLPQDNVPNNRALNKRAIDYYSELPIRRQQVMIVNSCSTRVFREETTQATTTSQQIITNALPATSQRPDIIHAINTSTTSNYVAQNLLPPPPYSSINPSIDQQHINDNENSQNRNSVLYPSIEQQQMDVEPVSNIDNISEEKSENLIAPNVIENNTQELPVQISPKPTIDCPINSDEYNFDNANKAVDVEPIIINTNNTDTEPNDVYILPEMVVPDKMDFEEIGRPASVIQINDYYNEDQPQLSIVQKQTNPKRSTAGLQVISNVKLDPNKTLDVTRLGRRLSDAINLTDVFRTHQLSINGNDKIIETTKSEPEINIIEEDNVEEPNSMQNDDEEMEIIDEYLSTAVIDDKMDVKDFETESTLSFDVQNSTEENDVSLELCRNSIIKQKDEPQSILPDREIDNNEVVKFVKPQTPSVSSINSSVATSVIRLVTPHKEAPIDTAAPRPLLKKPYVKPPKKLVVKFKKPFVPILEEDNNVQLPEIINVCKNEKSLLNELSTTDDNESDTKIKCKDDTDISDEVPFSPLRDSYTPSPIHIESEIEKAEEEIHEEPEIITDLVDLSSTEPTSPPKVETVNSRPTTPELLNDVQEITDALSFEENNEKIDETTEIEEYLADNKCSIAIYTDDNNKTIPDAVNLQQDKQNTQDMKIESWAQQITNSTLYNNALSSINVDDDKAVTMMTENNDVFSISASTSSHPTTSSQSNFIAAGPSRIDYGLSSILGYNDPADGEDFYSGVPISPIGFLQENYAWNQRFSPQYAPFDSERNSYMDLDMCKNTNSNGERAPSADSLNIRTDEKMPAKGEISEQESNGDIDGSWSHQIYPLQDALPRYTSSYDTTVARESWSLSNDQNIPHHNVDNLSTVLPKFTPLQPTQPDIKPSLEELTPKLEKSKNLKARKYRCPECPKVFSVLKEKRSHLIIDHDYQQRPPRNKITCTTTSGSSSTISTITSEYSSTLTNEISGLQLIKPELPLRQSPASMNRYLLNYNWSILRQKLIVDVKYEAVTLPALPVEGNIYLCMVCKERFFSIKSYDAHLSIHPAECYTCGRMFKHWGNLSVHLKRHLNIRDYSCLNCNKKFVLRQNLQEHMNTHSGDTPLQCKICSKRFRRYSNLIQHRNRHHLKIRPKEKDYICFCGEVFHSEAKIAWHRETHDKKPKCCPYCRERFMHKNSLSRHIRLSHMERFSLFHQQTVECPICNKKYMKSSLKAHLAVHSIKTPFECSICNKGFTTKWNLKQHKWIHASRSSKPFKCTMCLKAFIREAEFTSHMNTHKSIKPYTCDHCGCQFARKYNWLRHTREHETPKKYRCDDCGKVFHRAYYLTEHRRSHTGERPFECIICGKTSTTKTNHNKHVKIHHARDPLTAEG